MTLLRVTPILRSFDEAKAVADIDALQAELAAKTYPQARPLVETRPWGTRDRTVTDPFGNRLTFTHAISL